MSISSNISEKKHLTTTLIFIKIVGVFKLNNYVSDIKLFKYITINSLQRTFFIIRWQERHCCINSVRESLMITFQT